MKKWFPILFTSVGLGMLFYSVQAIGQIDCVYPGRVSVKSLSGRVFDPLGVPIPGVVLTLDRGETQVVSTTSDANGRFRFKALSGMHRLTAEAPGFEKAIAGLDVGFDLVNSLHSNSLLVILGFGGSTCSWVTTSKHEFLREIHANEKRFQEAAKSYATQK